jgi:hypothetical protein
MSSYRYIVNPLTNRKINVDSRLGRQLIQIYNNQLGGNKECVPVSKDHSLINLEELVGKENYSEVRLLLEKSNIQKSISFLKDIFQIKNIDTKHKIDLVLPGNQKLEILKPTTKEIKEEKIDSFIKTNLKIKFNNDIYSFYYDMGFLSFECNIDENKPTEINKYYEIDYSENPPYLVEDE